MSELKALPCPFCGDEPFVVVLPDGGKGYKCQDDPGCGIGPWMNLAAWNCRADDAGRLRTGVVGEIAAERERQKSVEGWTPKHDDAHGPAVLSRAAAAYCLGGVRPSMWPWDWKWWKPTTHRRDLIKAAALIVAEIERIDRAALTPKGE